MVNEELKEIVKAHGMWVRNEGGKRADLSGANLIGAELVGANLSGADLVGAALIGANLSGADLSGADLRGANLCRADLSGADLVGADLIGADLRGANLPSKIIQVGPIGSRKDYTIYLVDEDIVQCGCWNNYKGGSLDDFKKRIDEVYPDGQYRQEYLAAIAMFERLRESKR